MKKWLIFTLLVASTSSCFKTKTPVEIFLSENGFENLESLNSQGNTPLVLALDQNKKQIAKDIIEIGADVNGKAEDGRTPLLSALEGQDEELVELLLSKGAVFDYYDNKSGLTPIQIAVENGNVNIIRSLIDAGADNSSLYLIKDGKAGLFRVGMLKDDILYNILAYDNLNIDSSVINSEGTEIVIYKIFVDAEHDCIEIFYDQDLGDVYLIKIYCSDFKTEEGICVGSTYEESSIAYGELTPEWGDKGEPVLIVHDKRISFVLENDGWWLSGKVRKGSDPSGAEIKSVIVW
ncbi:ankyrin repeat domain-containing protein [candidate division WOR-3 bacterium]|nr:ankyrin repeat domain-containing protein [candidate division WOR-3 bacterium]